MRIVLQRVSRASVTVDGAVVGGIENGLVALVGVNDADTEEIAQKYAEKIFKMRIFADADGKTNLSAADLNYGVLVISQFTLYADTRKGNRPSFTNAGAPEHAKSICDAFTDACGKRFKRTESGVFGAHMSVALVNDGPFTIILDSD
ncbi:MAG: D-tyrosyl-tRNA(Tyr) deacylase [Clostridiales bacterium]|jgi:D-tyrosyl-tRNA(Tyr) deacylase|nr:D-tyrosyl-tRNA(Tyr) deacylase [Clostridiales bacterium]